VGRIGAFPLEQLHREHATSSLVRALARTAIALGLAAVASYAINGGELDHRSGVIILPPLGVVIAGVWCAHVLGVWRLRSMLVEPSRIKWAYGFRELSRTKRSMKGGLLVWDDRGRVAHVSTGDDWRALDALRPLAGVMLGYTPAQQRRYDAQLAAARGKRLLN
jgi:hypothetical protein